MGGGGAVVGAGAGEGWAGAVGVGFGASAVFGFMRFLKKAFNPIARAVPRGERAERVFGESKKERRDQAGGPFPVTHSPPSADESQ